MALQSFSLSQIVGAKLRKNNYNNEKIPMKMLKFHIYHCTLYII